MKYIAVALCLILVLYKTSAFFDTSVLNIDSNRFDLTNILECTLDGANRFVVPIAPSGVNSILKPEITG